MDIERWKKFTFSQQMGNIGSELVRARLCEEKKDVSGNLASLERVLEMIDASLPQIAGLAGKKEICRVRDVVAAWYVRKNVWLVPLSFLEQYFTQFVSLKV